GTLSASRREAVRRRMISLAVPHITLSIIALNKGDTIMELHHTASLEGFRSEVLKSSQLQAKLRLAQSAEDVIALASNLGFAINAAQLSSLDGASTVKLSEPELDTVAGAFPCWCDPSVVDSKSCSPN